jgi:uncharacterized phage protein (TIGR01671 family)
MTPEFRVWNGKEFDYCTLRARKGFSPQESGVWYDLIQTRPKDVISGTLTFHGEAKIEQYTGMKDVNGNKIFEGDIVRIDDYETVAVRYGTQDHEEDYGDHFMYKGWNVNLGGGYPDATMNDLKILGNIHENPELLEVDR